MSASCPLRRSHCDRSTRATESGERAFYLGARALASVLKLETKTDSRADVLKVEIPARQAPCNFRPHHAGIDIEAFCYAVVDHGRCGVQRSRATRGRESAICASARVI